MLAIDLLGRVGFATLLGVLIGIERQWRSRMAGLQTMALVSMGSALFLILGAFAFRDDGSDRLRIAAQIVSGIGFLGAGVIMKHGSSVTGLNTAATLWATAAVGALAGAWMWREALAGAAIIIVGNTFLHPLAVRMDGMKSTSREIASAEYLFEIVCNSDAMTRLRAMVVEALTNPAVQLKSLQLLPTSADGQARVRAELSASARDDAILEDAVRELGTDDDVLAVRWTTVDDAAASWIRPG